MKAVRMTASWCQPCKSLARTLDLQGINIEAVDIDENREMAMKYNIRGVPTILILDDDGVEVERIVGAMPNDAQFEKLKELSI
jgi:thioredoxin 1